MTNSNNKESSPSSHAEDSRGELTKETEVETYSTQEEGEKPGRETNEPLTQGESQPIGELESELMQRIKVLEQSRDEWQAKANEYLDGWQRSRAEFANYKKRVDREQVEIYQRTAGNILKRYLEVVDDLERALRNRPKEGDGADWSEGIELVYRKLTNILESEGVKVMQTEGETFDPNYHEAISSEESPDHESGIIIEALQKGYLLGDRVLRPALVRVAR
jgi:molecular chaperone GrpE